MIFRISSLFALLSLLSLLTQAKKFDSWKERQWAEFEEFLEWKKSKQLAPVDHRTADSSVSGVSDIWEHRHDYERKDRRRNWENRENREDPPPVDEAALMGRYIVNQADWTSVATISSRKNIETYPFVNVVSFSDGPLGNGSGIPYLFLTPLDSTAQDLSKDHRATLLMTLSQGDYCKNQDWDPMDPRCARILLSGKIKPLRNGSAELEIAKQAVFGRHPKLIGMPSDHRFFLAKLKIESIAVLDTFGGPKYVSVKDYLHPPTTNIVDEFNRHFPLKKKMSEGSSSEEKSDTLLSSNSFYPVVRNV